MEAWPSSPTSPPLFFLPASVHPLQYPLCLSLLSSGRVDATPLITHRFAFSSEGVAAGFEAAHMADQHWAVKVMFNVSRSLGSSESGSGEVEEAPPLAD